MKKIFPVILIFSIIVGFISCETEPNNNNDIAVTILNININDSMKISQIVFNDVNTGFLCGGDKNISGSIYKTIDGGDSWTKCYHNDSLSVNDVFFLNDNVLFACGDSLLLLKSTDAGNTWETIRLDNLPYESYNVPYNSVLAFSEDKIYITGGEHYNKGLLSKTESGNYPWTHKTYDNQFNSMCFVSEYVGFFGGYGILLVTEDGGNNYDYIDLGNNDFVDLEIDNNLTVYALSDAGVLYSTSDLGYNWNTLIDDNKSEFTDMHFGDNLAVVCGRNGAVYLKYQNQVIWTKPNNIPSVNFYCSFAKSNDEVFLGSDNGNIYILNHRRTN